MSSYHTLSAIALSLFGKALGDIPTCEFILEGTPILNDSYPNDTSIPSVAEYDAALPSLVIADVFDDLYELLRSSDECFPPDTFATETYDSYAGLMIRLAWHCAGTFRDTDGVGGCAGGRQRYEGEASMDDNVNLDKARALLYPIKETYGDALSWGDLFVFAGTAAILQGGGPVTEVCAGRIDNVNGALSDPLFYNDTCMPDGDCQAPLGAAKLGLIYVDAGGFLGEPDPNATAPHIREVFARMGMNDSETVALIGGGHAFGKAHGACPTGPGDAPNVNPTDPWAGTCGDDYPSDVFTSGFEGQWTTYPFTWDNEYFTQLRDDEYTATTSPANANQFVNTRTGYLMLVTDIALKYDEAYYEIVMEFANDQDALDDAFGNVWKKLMTSGGTFSSAKFCVDGDTLAPETMTTTMMPDDDDMTSTMMMDDSGDDMETTQEMMMVDTTMVPADDADGDDDSSANKINIAIVSVIAAILSLLA